MMNVVYVGSVGADADVGGQGAITVHVCVGPVTYR